MRFLLEVLFGCFFFFLQGLNFEDKYLKFRKSELNDFDGY